MPDLIRAVLLDFDGTLVDSERLHYESWMAAVEPLKGYVSWRGYRERFVGKTDEWCGQTLLEEAGHEVNPALLARVVQAKHHYYRDRAETIRIPEETARFVLERLSHLLVGVVTSSLSRDVEPALRRAGLDQRLQTLVAGDHVVNHKPDPEPYLRALNNLRERDGKLQAEQCAVFEDSQSGIASAKAAGMKVTPAGDPRKLATLLKKTLQL